MSDPENTLLMQLDSGTVTIRLRPDLAPNHVTRAKELARAGFYDGVGGLGACGLVGFESAVHGVSFQNTISSSKSASSGVGFLTAATWAPGKASFAAATIPP